MKEKPAPPAASQQGRGSENTVDDRRRLPRGLRLGGRFALSMLVFGLMSGCGPVQQIYEDWLDEAPPGQEEQRSGLKQELEERRIAGNREARKKEWDAYNECLNRKSFGDPLVIFRVCRQPSGD